MRADKSLSPFEIRVTAITALCMVLGSRWHSCSLFHYPPVYYPGKHLAAGHHGGVMGPISFWGNVVPRAFERIGVRCWGRF